MYIFNEIKIHPKIQNPSETRETCRTKSTYILDIL